MNIDDFPEDSDTSDDDYVPEGKPEEVVSEVDSDGDPEEPLSDAEDTGKRGKKRTKKATKSRKKPKNDDSKPAPEMEQVVKEADKKKQEEDIWADFMKDTGFLSKSSAKSEPVDKTNGKPNKESPSIKPKEGGAAATTKPKQEKVKITQIFEFAGEEVTVEKEVAANSAEARLLSKQPAAGEKPVAVSKGRSGGLSGIGSVLNQLGRKPKISTLEKSKLDWDKFKKEENIDEELQTHNKGKDGYLERQDFLQRADLRRFEIEKEARNVERSKRMNN